GAVNLHAAVFDFDPAKGFEKREKRRLADGGDKSVAGDAEFRAGDTVKCAVRVRSDCRAFDGLDRAAIQRKMDGNGLGPPAELDTFCASLVVLEREGSHVFLVASV